MVATVKLSRDLDNFLKQSHRLKELISNVGTLEPRYQRIIGEIVMLRLFGLIEQTICSIASKIVCGATYLNGSQPTILLQAATINESICLMRNHGRSSSISYLKWTKSTFINKNVKYLIDSSDSFIRVIDSYSVEINNMRRIRNHIAHNNSNTRSEFKLALQSLFGAQLDLLQK